MKKKSNIIKDFIADDIKNRTFDYRMGFLQACYICNTVSESEWSELVRRVVSDWDFLHRTKEFK